MTAAEGPRASVNFVTAHDGFTLRDLVSYNDKHNEANGENNQDGANDNESWNCGAEGPTDDPDVNALRARQQRNFLATLLLSQGVPMVLGGDELGRTQQGNNNAYCQDNEISWYDWDLDDERRALLALTRELIRVRMRHSLLRRVAPPPELNRVDGRGQHTAEGLAGAGPDGAPSDAQVARRPPPARLR